MNLLEINKTIISRALALLLTVLFITVPVSAFAASVSVKSSSEKVSVGDEITVTVSLGSATKAKSGGVEISFDGSLAYVTNSVKFKVDGTSLRNYDENNHKGAFAFNDTKEVSGDILTLKFKARYDGTPKISAKLSLRDGNNVVLEEASSVTITVGTGVAPTGAETTGSQTTAAQGETTVEIQTDENGNPILDGEDLLILSPDSESTRYGDADNSIFRRADGSVNVTLIIVIIASILIAITVVVVIIYNKRESIDETETKGDEKQPLVDEKSNENSKENEQDE